MSEPTRWATRLENVVPGVFRWSVLDDRIDFSSEAYAIDAPGGLILIDPLPIEPGILGAQGRIQAICITGGFHQRSAWRLRRELGVEVLAPLGAAGLMESADRWFEDGEQPVAGLTAVACHGPTNPHFVFRWETPSGQVIVFCGDLLMRESDGPLSFVPDDHQEDPGLTREAARRLLQGPIDVLCPAHGPPVLGRVGEAIRAALAP